MFFSESWGYPSDNSAWGCVCESSMSQSPIDLPNLILAASRNDLQVEFTATNVEGFDTGHSLEWEVKTLF